MAFGMVFVCNIFLVLHNYAHAFRKGCWDKVEVCFRNSLHVLSVIFIESPKNMITRERTRGAPKFMHFSFLFGASTPAVDDDTRVRCPKIELQPGKS